VVWKTRWWKSSAMACSLMLQPMDLLEPLLEALGQWLLEEPLEQRLWKTQRPLVLQALPGVC